MAKSGRAGAALATAAIGSFVAGTIATVIVTLFAPFVAEFAVKLGPPEYFMLMVLAFTTVSAVLGKSTLRGMTALFLGLAIGCIGLDQISGQGRYTVRRARAAGRHRDRAGGGRPVRRGRGAVCRACTKAAWSRAQNKLSRVHMSKRDWKRSIPAWLRGTAIGAPFGCIPAGGTEIPTFLSYATEKKLAKGEGPGRVRHQGRDRRRGRPRGGQQRHGDGRADPAAHARHPDLQHHGHPAGRLPELRHPAGPAAVHRPRPRWCGR